MPSPTSSSGVALASEPYRAFWLPKAPVSSAEKAFAGSPPEKASKTADVRKAHSIAAE
ncbi:hypothetical protein ACHMW7_18600 [Aminobacter sp. UC22_36]|uniref:hypothetical protein n=1 Tax=Aminobacter sp. UC22_36 TaxID=3374549 RepID=UPI0037579E59